MAIYAMGFGLVLLMVQAYSASQKDIEKKVVLWKAILMSLFWFITLPVYMLAKADVCGLSKAIKKLFNMPVA
jgi:hypothetical protein